MPKAGSVWEKGAHVRGRRGRTRDAGVVSPSEGNEVRREGRSGVGASRSIVEAGEQALLVPVEKRGCRIAGPSSENTPRASNLTSKSMEGRRTHMKAGTAR